jgi:hypothetical protein
VLGHGSGLPFPVDFDRSLEPLFHNLDFTSGCRDSLLRLLLEGMKDVDSVFQPDGVDSSDRYRRDGLQTTSRVPPGKLFSGLASGCLLPI